VESNRRHGDFQSRNPNQAVSTQFQSLIYQAVTGALLEYVGLCWAVFGFGGYMLVAVQMWGVSEQNRRTFEKGEQKACVHSRCPGFFPCRMDKFRSAW
jgi:hypothetical protein